jgi:Bacterial Ig domain
MNRKQKATAAYSPMKNQLKQKLAKTFLASMALLGGMWSSYTHAVPVTAPVGGEIEKITLNDASDHWSGGVIVAGGQNIVIPRNLLIDLPANRVTLKQLFDEASGSCKTQNETGLAKGDKCNRSGTGGLATIQATRLDNGNVIAGDVFIQKAAEVVTGQITYINYEQGYFRINGKAGVDGGGVMVRLNDPDSRHTIQSGAGCKTGSLNCSPDPRFTLDGDNYTNVFSTGYPMCIPSTKPGRSLAIPVPGVASITPHDGTLTGDDTLCPRSNRPANNATPVADSRRFAPILVGDSIMAEGNYEEVSNVKFLSAHSTAVSAALATSIVPGQPDYMFLDEVEMDAPGFQNQRARTLIIGYATLAPTDIMIWSIHYDPKTNSPHEFPLASSLGCDNAAGVGTCSAQGLVAAGANIFKIRHDVDFAVPTKDRLDPCVHLKADGRFPANICPNTVLGQDNDNFAEQFAILSPIPHEIQARTGRKYTDMTSGNPPQLITVDINGNEATNGQYLFPFGMGLGGVSTPEMNEINLDAMATPLSFTGIPWNLDRRLSPGGCIDTNNDGVVDCEPTAQPLSPFPFEGAAMDPRTLGSLPTTPYSDPNYVSGTLASVRDRILSYVDPTKPTRDNAIGVNNEGNFIDGNDPQQPLLTWDDPAVVTAPSSGPGGDPVGDTPIIDIGQNGGLICSGNSEFNSPPVAQNDSDWTSAGVAKTIWVLSNDSDANGDTLTVTGLRSSIGGSPLITITTSNGNTVDLAVNGGITFTPTVTGTDTFFYDVTDGHGGTATGTVTINVNTPPVAENDGVSTLENTAVDVHPLEYATDADGDTLTVTSIGTAAHGTVTLNANIATYMPNANFIGMDTFTYTVADGKGGTATGIATVTVNPHVTVNTPPPVSSGAIVSGSVLSASSSAPMLVFTKKSVKFAGATRNADKQMTVTVKNIGNVAIKPKFLLKGKGFSKVSSNCRTLGVNRSCSVVVRFNSPAKKGTAKGTLSVMANGMPNTVTTNLIVSR